MSKTYPFKLLVSKALTHDEIVEDLKLLKTGTKWFWGLDILKVDNETIIERYSNKRYTIYVHYSCKKDPFNTGVYYGEYKQIEIKADSPWYIFKVCVYERQKRSQ